MEYDYSYFKREAELLTGLDLDLYKEKQMKRRINTLIERRGLDGYRSFVELLRRDRAQLEYFTGYLTINVTEFFRTPEHWHGMETDVLETIVKERDVPLRVWSAACSTGEEPYSLAMSLSRLQPLSDVRVLATDVDTEVLQKAMAGIYPEKSMESIPEDLRERFFARDGDRYRARDELRRCVEFHRMDLLKEAYPEEMDLIVCRNVLIYFTEEAKERVFRGFRRSLRVGGYLFTGNTEQIINYRQMGYKRIRPYIYRKVSI